MAQKLDRLALSRAPWPVQYQHARLITPTDDEEVTHEFRGFVTSTSGPVVITCAGDPLTVKFKIHSVAGTIYPIAIRHVWLGSSASQIVGLL